MIDINYDTFDPVVAWSSVRVFLVLSLNLGWKTVSVGLTNAFVQKPLDNLLYMQTLSGFINKCGHLCCLKVKKSIYGSVFSP